MKEGSASHRGCILSTLAGLVSGLLIGCSGGLPSAADGEKFIREKIHNESEGRIRLISFNKTNGQNREVSGVRVYSLEYESTLEFIEECGWLTGEVLDRSFKSFQTGKARRGLPMERGQRQSIFGAIVFEMTEKGWRPVSTEMRLGQTPEGVDPTAPARRCLTNLKQIGLGGRLWAVDHDDKMPADFLSMRGELGQPALLVCPSDLKWNRGSPTNWSQVAEAQISYEMVSPGIEDNEENANKEYVRCPIHRHVVYVGGSTGKL